MKKLIVFSLLWTCIASGSEPLVEQKLSAEQEIDQLIADIKKVPINFFDRPTKDHLENGKETLHCLFYSFCMLGKLSIPTGGIAIEKIDEDTFTQEKNNSLCATSLNAVFFGGAMVTIVTMGTLVFFKNYTTKLVAKIDKPLLLIVHEGGNNRKKMLKLFEDHYAPECFPLTKALGFLGRLDDDYTEIIAFFESLQNKKPAYTTVTKNLIEQIKKQQKTVKNALQVLTY